jgi:thiamine-monophosphate kinase
MKTTDISTLGEFALIDRLTKNTKLHHASTVKGIGDDAAVLSYGDKMSLVSTDMLVEGVHFNLMYTPLMHLGYKAVIVNLSDIFAMNGEPKQVFVNIAVSNRFPLEAVEEIYKGIHKACRLYKVDLAGGDTTSSVKGLVISVTAVGEVKSENICYRKGASKNELLCVSGDLGAAYAGLKVLERENEIFKKNPEIQPDISAYKYIAERQLKPEARGDLIELFKQLNIKPTSMIDISDGLSSELMHICKASDTGCYVYEDKLPLAPETKAFAEETQIPASIFAMNGGEDYELLFTIKQEDYKQIETNPAITVIGHITDKEKGQYIITPDEKEVPIQAQGWNTFDRPDDQK